MSESKTEYAARVAHLSAILAGLGLSPYDCAMRAQNLVREGYRAAKIAENLCNIPDYQGQKRFEALLRRVKEYLPQGWRAQTSGDPRGYCLHLFGKGLSANTMGGEEDGYGV
jgi:hypothetical protein